MKRVLGLVSLTILLVFLTACSGTVFRTNESSAESNHNLCSNIYIFQQHLHVALYDAEHSSDELQDVRVISMRIHPDLPEFTFTRIIGDYANTHYVYDIPVPVETTIVIKDDSGAIVQTISGLSQSRPAIDSDITFDDFNFDDYLDMRLIRWHDTGQSMRAVHYVWLWDAEEFQFILNEQLTEMWTADITAHSDVQQIETWIRNIDGFTSSFYIYLNWEFILVSYDRIFQVWDEHGYLSHTKTVRTNVLTDEVVIAIDPSGADFVLSRMAGSDIREYVRVVANNRAYELFVLCAQYDDYYVDFHESKLVISDIIDGEYHYLVSFAIPERRANATGGLILVDVDFDGVKDVLVWLGREGNQGFVTYAAFLSRGHTYIETNFHWITNPTINSTKEKVMGGIRSWAVGHYSFLYVFIDDKFIMTDSFLREACRDTHELRYVVTFREGQYVNEIYWYKSDKEKIEILFYNDESRWQILDDKWQRISRLH